MIGDCGVGLRGPRRPYGSDPFSCEQHPPNDPDYRCLPMSGRAELTRLILQLERDLAVQRHLKVLLAAAATTVTSRRTDVRNLKARMARGPSGRERIR